MNCDLKTIDRIEHILEKGTGAVNEDCLLIEKNIFGVFDGASSLDKDVYKNGDTGGLIAARTAQKTFAKNHFSLKKLGIAANTAIRSQMAEQMQSLAPRHKLWSTSASVVRVKDDEIEWFQTGDSQIIVLKKDGSFCALSNRQDQDFETLKMLKKLNFEFTPDFLDQIKKVRTGMNRNYGVLNGESTALDFVQGGRISTQDVTCILLFTDGLTVPSETPTPQKTFDELVELFQNLGLSGLKDHIRQLEAQDPKIQKYPRFKCHDDIAAIAVYLDN